MKLKNTKGYKIGYSETPPNNLIDPVDMHAAMKSKNVAATSKDKVTAALLPNGMDVPVDTNWLASAARTYNISPSLTDYIVVPVILFYTDIPNKNGFALFIGQFGVVEFGARNVILPDMERKARVLQSRQQGCSKIIGHRFGRVSS